MKKTLILLLLAVSAFAMGQTSKKPTLMITPSDHWCEMRYFMTTYNDQGNTVKTPDLAKAFREDNEIGPVISKLGELLTGLGYSLKDAEQGIKSIAVRTGEDDVTMSKSSGASLVESPLDQLKRRLKSDILIQVSWTSNTFTLEAFDSYTNKRIATSTGPMKGGGSVANQLFKSASGSIKTFDRQMEEWYADQNKNGREILLTVRCWDSWDKDLEEEYDGEELTDCIQSWMRKNTVNGAFNMSDGTESFAQFEQVRIPMFDEKGNAMDARAFATKLRKHLSAAPYNITAKVMQRGLGEAIIVLGEK